MTVIEQYARRHGRLHPSLVSVLDAGFFSRRIPVWSASRLKVLIKPQTWTPFMLSGRREGPTPAFTILERLYVAEGLLNSTATLRGVSGDFATPEGIAWLLHEAGHAYQHFRSGAAWMLKMYIKTIFSSWQASRILWDHAESELEAEASEWQAEMFRWARLHQGELAKFREMR